MNQIEYNDLEKAIFEMNLAGNDPLLAELRSQFEKVIPGKREFTGVGFYLDLAVKPGTQPLDISKFKNRVIFGVVGAKLGKDNIDSGYLIFIENGYFTLLEGYTYGDDKWPDDYLDFTMYYFNDQTEQERIESIYNDFKPKNK